MKIRELFKQIEQANKIAKVFGDGYGIRICDGYRGYDWEVIHATYAEFKKWVKEEINKPWADALLGNGEMEQTSDTTYCLNALIDTYRGTEMYAPSFEIVNNVTTWSVR